jgi:4-hydroxybenzoyl-CoA thioesterase
MPFRTRLEVRFADIDLAGVVYFPRFLHYCHVAMEEFFARELDFSYPRLFAEHRCGFPAVHLNVDFRQPLRYGDIVTIDVEILKLGRTSVTWRYTLHREGSTAVSAQATIVTACLDLDRFRARRVPEWLQAKLVACLVANETPAPRP